MYKILEMSIINKGVILFKNKNFSEAIKFWNSIGLEKQEIRTHFENNHEGVFEKGSEIMSLNSSIQSMFAGQ